MTAEPTQSAKGEIARYDQKPQNGYKSELAVRFFCGCMCEGEVERKLNN